MKLIDLSAGPGLRKKSASAALVALCLLPACSTSSQRQHYKVTHQYGTSDPQFERTMNNLLGPGLRPGNKITTLRNGDEIFPSMLAAIRGARRTIDFETYIYWKGD